MHSSDQRKRRFTLGAGVILLLLALIPLWQFLKPQAQPTPVPPLPLSPMLEPVVPAAPVAARLSEEEQWFKDHDPKLLTPVQLQRLYESLIQGYWTPQTGLFLSFPNTPDLRLQQQAATYDQGVMGVLLLKLGDLEKVKKLLSFYEREWSAAENRSGPRQGIFGLSNFYNAYFIVEGVEKTMHVGPNAWIGLVASRYYRQTGDLEAQGLALKIARWMIEKVPHTDGAIAMGQIPWNTAPWDKIYSTENNLSAYAFLGDLLKAKTLPEKDRQSIQNERLAIGRWLLQKAYQPKTQTVLRGFHPHGLDQAGAIDSYTWFISSLRPETLRAHEIPIDALVARAQNDFTAHVNGHLGIDAVDRAMAQATYDDALVQKFKDVNFYRPSGDDHRLIWYEGQGQFIVALQDAAHEAAQHAFSLPEGPQRTASLNQASQWLEAARLYTAAMDKAALVADWGTSYPCATQGRFYLYGWPAPQPLQGRLADASAPLAWRLFAGMGYEPLTDTQLGPPNQWNVRPLAQGTPRDPGTAILYGASEEMMVQAWKLYEQGAFDAAWRQAKATVRLWEADAVALQKTKKEKVGTYLPFDGTVAGYQGIHDYWALNDVASCYFVLAKISDQQKNYAEAKGYLEKILKDFYLAQMWDKRGWFWNPVETIKSEYAGAKPDTYGDLLAQIPDIPSLTAEQVLAYEAAHHDSPLPTEIAKANKEADSAQ